MVRQKGGSHPEKCRKKNIPNAAPRDYASLYHLRIWSLKSSSVLSPQGEDIFWLRASDLWWICGLRPQTYLLQRLYLHVQDSVSHSFKIKT